MKFAVKTLALAAMAVSLSAAYAQKGETVRIAMIEGLSGPMANVGQNQLKSWQFLADQLNGANNPAGVKFEIVGMDSKGCARRRHSTLSRPLLTRVSATSPRATVRGAALALSDAVAKHNERNPGKEIVYLNYCGRGSRR